MQMALLVIGFYLYFSAKRKNRLSFGLVLRGMGMNIKTLKAGIIAIIPILKYNKVMKKNELDIVKEYFEKQKIVSREELVDFLFNAFSDTKKEYSRFYLSDIVKNEIAYPVRTGTWKVAEGKKTFCYSEEKDDMHLLSTLTKIMPPTKISFWNTGVLNSFMELQSFQNFTIVSSFKYCLEEITTALVHSGFMAIPLKLFQKTQNIIWPEKAILVSSFNEDAPLLHGGTRLSVNSKSSIVLYPRLEKILVDCYCGDVALDPSQIREIFISSFKRYFIDYSVLERYARSRGKKEEIISLLSELGINEKSI